MGTDSPEGSRSEPGDTTAVGGSSAFMVLVLHLFTFVCCANWIFGPLGIVFAARSAMNRDQGRLEHADVYARYSWYCLGAGLVMLIVMVVLVFALALLGLPFADRLVTPY